MIDIVPLHAWAAVLSQSAVVLALLIPGLLVYGALADQAIFEGRGRVRVQALGPADLLVGGILAGLFLLLIAGGWRDANAPAAANAALPGAAAMIGEVIVNTFVFLAIMVGIIASLSLRQIAWREVFGLDRLSPGAVLARAIVLLLLALPLIGAALAISQVLLAAGGSEDASHQEIVRFLAGSRSGVAKAVVTVSAVLLAPLQEEFIFRGYIYGVLRRYAGVPLGILVNAALFAGIHLHAPSFGGLFVLAVCLTLAYEWTGSLLVPMVMHALFNSISVVNLLAGGTGS
jgi:membrane protease YdiL (CAAX protease family)